MALYTLPLMDGIEDSELGSNDINIRFGFSKSKESIMSEYDISLYLFINSAFIISESLLLLT